MRLSRLWQCREPFIWLSDFIARRRVMRGTRQQLEDSQRRRFRRLVRFVWKRSRYYHDVMITRGLDPETCELHQFPVLTRQTLIERFDDIVTDRRLSRERLAAHFAQGQSPTQLLDHRYHVIHSSGTTGRQVYMAYSPREWIRGLSHQIRFAGGLQWRKRCAFVGVTRAHFAGYSISLAARRGINRLFYDSRSIDASQPLSQVVSQLNEFQPRVLTAYASCLSMLAEEQRAGRLRIRPRCLISSGDALLSEQRPLIEQAFDAPVKDVYAATETLTVGCADSADGTMTLYEDDMLFELAKDHFCVTSLFHKTTPLIRYRLEDAFQFVSPGDSKPLRSVNQFMGRSTQSLRFRTNHGTEALFTPMLLLALPTQGVAQYQLVYEEVDRFEFRVRLDMSLSPREGDGVLDAVRTWLQQLLIDNHLDRSVSFVVETVDNIPADPRTGKVQLIQHAAEVKHAA